MKERRQTLSRLKHPNQKRKTATEEKHPRKGTKGSPKRGRLGRAVATAERTGEGCKWGRLGLTQEKTRVKKDKEKKQVVGQKKYGGAGVLVKKKGRRVDQK